MKSVLRKVNDENIEYDCLIFVCPGCELFGYTGLHMIPVNTDAISPSWEWNGDLYEPTITPSLLTTTGDNVCHSFLTNGDFNFLSDSTHALKLCKIRMPDLPDWVEQ